MSILYIRHPSKASVESASASAAPPGAAPACAFALASEGGAIEREGWAALPALAGMAAKADRTLLLLAASDVSLLRVKTPPLTGAKLLAALPGLVEEQLISDPADCAVLPVSGPGPDGMRAVAVVQRAWLETLHQSLAAIGARRVQATPSQLCLPWQPDTLSAALGEVQEDGCIDLTLRLSEHGGMGLPIAADPAGRPDAANGGHTGADSGRAAAEAALHMLRLLAPEGAATLYVPQAQVPLYQSLVDAGTTVVADNWQRWIAGATAAHIDLLAAIGARGDVGRSLARWRWPLALAAAVALVHVVGLNVEWLRGKREMDTLRASLVQTFRNVFPNETTILDPVAQMKQKIAAAKNAAGQPGVDDFTAMAAAFAETWVGRPGLPEVGALEYKDRSLVIKFKPGGAAPLDEMKGLLAARKLSLTETAAGVWQIRSGK